MDGSTKNFMENRFGADFSGVRIHTADYAVQMSRDLNAQAFTVGNDIYFNSGKYSPDSAGGKHLLAHELTHTIQQNGRIDTKLIQRTLAVTPTVPGAVGKALSTSQTNVAIKWNQAAFKDADEITLLREVLEIPLAPAVIDEDFVKALVQYQAYFGLSQDGLIGAGTALKLANELKARGSSLGAAADVGSSTEIAINPAEKRTRLRSRVVSRLGDLLFQGFVGNRDSPTGVVTARAGFQNPGIAGSTNAIGINYTGNDADNARWLQFTFSQMSAINPTTKATTYNTGTVVSTGGSYSYSNGTTFNWNVDTVPATASMYYDAGGTSERVAADHTEIFDEPGGWSGRADTFASGASFAAKPTRVRVIKGFDTYLIINDNKVVYHVRWNLYFNFNTSSSPVADVKGNYEVLTAGSISKLPADRKAILDTKFPTNTVP